MQSKDTVIEMKNKMKIDKTLIITSLMCLVPLVMYLVVWNKLPEEMPIHFDNNGNPNGYASKAFAAIGLPLILLAVNVFVNIFVEADPKKRNAGKEVKALGKWTIPIISIIINLVVIMVCLNIGINVSAVIYGLVGVLFVAIGNYLPKCRQNYTVGIKLPWTLNNEVNWQKTHRLAGVVFMAAGALMLLNILLNQSWLIIAAIAVAVILPMVYSFILYKKGY